MQLLGCLVFVILVTLCWCQAETRAARSLSYNSGCAINQVNTPCRQTCRPTCSDPNPYCIQDCSSSGCQCLAGYVFDINNQCIPRHQCTQQFQKCSYNYQCPVSEVCGASGYCHRQVVQQIRRIETVQSSSTYSRNFGSRPNCVYESDCVNGLSCRHGRCMTITEITRIVGQGYAHCRTNGDCASGLICLDRVCKDRAVLGVNEHIQSGTTLCRVNRDCIGGKSCVDRICREL